MTKLSDEYLLQEESHDTKIFDFTSKIQGLDERHQWFLLMHFCASISTKFESTQRQGQMYRKDPTKLVPAAATQIAPPQRVKAAKRNHQ